ncbi:MAG: lysylphosphatidylglycerol synthase transmembrane domain-containing protein [Thermoleophilia bacterium]
MIRVVQLARRHWFKVFALALIVYVLVFHVEWDEFARVFRGVAWHFVLLAIIANLASILLKAASWKIIFDFSFRDIHSRWRDLISAIMIGFLVNALIPARVGELARAYTISRREGILGRSISKSTVLGTVALERVFDGLAMTMIVIYGVVKIDLPRWAHRGAFALIFISALFAVLLVSLEIKRERLSRGAARAAEKHREHHTWWRKTKTRLYSALARFSEGQQALRSPGRVAAIFCTTSLSWLSQLTAVYFSMRAFHLGHIGMLGALLLLILINIAGAMPATPGNIGVFQLATVIPLVATYGISKTTALAFSIGLQAIEGSIGLGVGSICLLREGLTFGQVRSESLRDFGSAQAPAGAAPDTAGPSSDPETPVTGERDAGGDSA